jgi:pimeloyl-ACP methyl ester carboxylesterase
MTHGTAPTRRGGDYVQTGEVRTYYEVHGEGDPLVLLHGGLCTVETFDGLAPGLAERFRVYVPERRGHGRTADVDGPITYVNMAQDTIAFMDTLGISGAHLVGFSDGAAVAVHVALERPELVSRLVLIGQALNHDTLPPGLIEALDDLAAHLPPMLAQLYGAVSPDGPEHFEVIIDKLAATWRTEPSFTLDTLATVTAPALFMMGDNDAVTLEHADAVRRTIPGSQLAVVPGATHGLPMEKPDIAARLTLDFLAGG